MVEEEKFSFLMEALVDIGNILSSGTVWMGRTARRKSGRPQLVASLDQQDDMSRIGYRQTLFLTSLLLLLLLHPSS
jgi:hypothetical protein